MSKSRLALAAAAAVAVSSYGSVSMAASYASGISESGGTVSYILNEAADDITVVRDGVATSLGALPKGTHTFQRDGAATYHIQVSKTSGAGYTTASAPNVGTVLQISDDTQLANSFNAPRGVAVNTNPGTLNFGRIYVTNASNATSTAGRAVSKGVYVLGADHSDVLGQGDTARSAGSTWAATGTSSPWMVKVGEDNNVYVSDWADSTGGLIRTDPNVTSHVEVLGGRGDSGGFNHGSIAGFAVRGTQADGNLTLWTGEEDVSASPPDVLRYDVGSGPLPHTSAASLTIGFPINATMDVDSLSNGNLLISQNRFGGTDVGSVFLTDSGGNILWDSLEQSRTLAGDSTAVDILRQARGIALSADEAWMAVAHDTGDVTVLQLDSSGVPDLANFLALDTFDIGFARDVAFDAAGNLYVISSGNQALRTFSPGGDTIFTTGSDGTFFAGTAPIPEPAGLALLGAAGLFLGGRRRRA